MTAQAVGTAVGADRAHVAGTRTQLVGIVLTVLAVLAGFWIAFGLMAVASPADFVPGVLLPLGEGWAHVVAVAVVGLAIVVSLALNLTGRQSVDAAAAAGAAPVTMDAFDFATTEVTVAAGSEAALLVSNRDPFLHDISVPEHDVAVTVTPGSQALLDVSSLAAGTYTFYCTLHSDTSDPAPATAGMAGTLVVQ